MDCSRSSRSASGQINLRCLASSCACSSRFQRTSRTSMDFLALWRVHPLKESIEERVIREDTVLRLFPALLAHEVLKQVCPIAARFVLARRRVIRDIHCAVKTPEYSSPPISATPLVSSHPPYEPKDA